MFEETVEQRNDRLRQRALELALACHPESERADDNTVLDTAEKFFQFLNKPQ